MKTNRSQLFQPPCLSKKDAEVPLKDYIPLYEIFVCSPEVRMLYGEETALGLRKKTFNNVLKLYHQYGSMDYCKFYNHHVEEIADMGLNEFTKYEPLQDLCYYIRAFSRNVVKQGKTRQEISFGIKRKTIEEYFIKKEEALRLGVPFVPPRTFQHTHKGILRKLDFGHSNIRFGTEIEVEVERGAIYKRFCHWCLAKGITKVEGLRLALRDIVDNEPIEEVLSLENYHVVTAFDQHWLTKEQYFTKTSVRKNFRIDTEILQLAEKIIYRYNLMPENAGESIITLNQYIHEALSLFMDKALDEANRKMPLKYSDPDMYAKLQQVKYKKIYQQKVVKDNGKEKDNN